MTDIETIDGIKGEWRTVTKASEVTIGQRVRYKFRNDDEKSFDAIHDYDSDTTNIHSVFNTLFRSNVQAFFPLPVKPAKRKVAKVRIVEVAKFMFVYVTKITGARCNKSKSVRSRKSALRGARRFCNAIGYECEVVK